MTCVITDAEGPTYSHEIRVNQLRLYTVPWGFGNDECINEAYDRQVASTSFVQYGGQIKLTTV